MCVCIYIITTYYTRVQYNNICSVVLFDGPPGWPILLILTISCAFIYIYINVWYYMVNNTPLLPLLYTNTDLNEEMTFIETNFPSRHGRCHNHYIVFVYIIIILYTMLVFSRSLKMNKTNIPTLVQLSFVNILQAIVIMILFQTRGHDASTFKIISCQQKNYNTYVFPYIIHYFCEKIPLKFSF